MGENIYEMHENRVNILPLNFKLFCVQNTQKSKEKHFRSNFLRVISKVSSNNVLSTQFRHCVLSSILYSKLKEIPSKIVRKFRQNRNLGRYPFVSPYHGLLSKLTSLCQLFLTEPEQGRNIDCSSLPNNGLIHSAIVMGNQVSHSFHRSSLNSVRCGLPILRRQSTAQFPNLEN